MEKEKIIIKDENFEYYKELVISAVGETDWNKNTGFYVKMYNEYKKYPGGENSIIEEVSNFKSILNERWLSDREEIENEAAYLNKSLQNGLTNLRVDNPEIKSNNGRTTEMININVIEINPGWATDKYLSDERVVIFNDGVVERKLIARNKTTHKLPNNTTMTILFEIERIYLENNCPEDRIITFYSYDMLKRLGWDFSKKSYENLKENLKILRYTEILSDKFYRYKDKNDKIKYIPGKLSFNILDSLEIYDEKDDEKVEEIIENDTLFDDKKKTNKKRIKAKVGLNKYFADNVRKKYYNVIRSSIYNKLESPIEFFLSLLLLKRSGQNKNNLVLRIDKLCEQIGVVTKDTYERKRNLSKTFEKLKEKNIIKNWEFKDELVYINFI